jgi:agmatinase
MADRLNRRSVMPHAFIAPARPFLDVPGWDGGAAPQSLIIFGAGHGTPYPQTNDVPYDTATHSAAAPHAIRNAATQSSSGIDHFDFDLDGPLLADGSWTLRDAGDLALDPQDGPANRAAITAATAAILAAGAVPVLLGGDDSVPVPFLQAYGGMRPIDILQIDAHIDWRDSIGGERMGYSSTMRRASEHLAVRSITQVGMRGVGSARPQEVAAARAWGARIVTVAEARDAGPGGIAALIPAGGRLVVQVDCDAFDPSVCGAVNAPTPGGFGFDELAAILRAAVMRHGLAGLSIVELVPARDPLGLSATAAARLVCNVIGAAARRPL